MKMICAMSIGSLVLASSSFAASVTVSDTSVPLHGVAAATIALLLDAGITPHNMGGGNFAVKAKGLHCDQRSNGPLDGSYPHSNLPTLKCRINAKNMKNTNTGSALGDGRALAELLQKVQAASSGIQIADCASGGYCGYFLKSINCTINTTIDNFSNGGRWSCVYEDGQ